jgi:transcriptional regulator with XRE-family HTH domain
MTFREIRDRAGFTQEALAASSGVPQSTISALEVGSVASPRYDTLSKLAAALGATTDEVAAAVANSAGAVA